ncbi:MAG TPA: dihydroorotate dehydrogenase [Acidimicrobiales bacterium]|nr:dihydroorotate dehydrogenase [Acidimicrobiales bacterium]
MPDRRRRGPGAPVDLTTSVGAVALPNPVMTASGTSGHGAELAPYLDLAGLGAVVVKSLSADAWAGNPAPRLHPLPAGMLNSVGLDNPGVAAWLADDLPPLAATGAAVVASIWGFSADDYRRAAAAVAAGATPAVVAVEANISCPNVEDRRRMFAHDPQAAAGAVAAAVDGLAGSGLPLWVKLSPNVTDLTEIAAAVVGAGAASLTLVNTVMGMAIDPATGAARLGAGGGGLSGPAVHAVAVRAVYECRAALPDIPIVGVGGVASGLDAAELLAAGAHAVQVGTATFADPRAPARVLDELAAWCAAHEVRRVADLVGRAHGARRSTP